eukprot:131889_1
MNPRTGYQKNEYLIWGFMRKSVYEDDEITERLYIPKVIKEMTLNFLGNMVIHSFILTEIETINVMNFLNNKIKSMHRFSNKNKNFNETNGVLTYNLLYRGSENGFDYNIFNQCCHDKGGNFGRLMLVETHYNNIFGAYFVNTNNDIKNTNVKPITDFYEKTKFLFTIRPNIFIKSFESKNAICDLIHVDTNGFGFGFVNDVYIVNNCDKTNKNVITFPPKIFNFGFNGNQLCGGNDLWGNGYHFCVNNIECYELL